MPTRCPHCNSELPKGALRCPRCGPRAAPTALQSIGERGTFPTELVGAHPASIGEKSTVPPPRSESAEPEEYGDLIFDEEVSEPEAPVQGLDPDLAYLLEVQPAGRFRPWPLRRPYHSVGRDGAKIALTDPRVSRRHLSVARVGPDWLAINRSARKSMHAGGRRLHQKTLRTGDVLRIGRTYLTFAESRSAGSPLRAMAGKLHGTQPLPGGHLATLGSLDEEASVAHCALHEGGHLLASSDGMPMLIGSHPVCAVVLSGPGVAAFHALLT